jgi:Concanavalin A-like lectin/glucanases superfamily/PEP-CTERM motif
MSVRYITIFCAALCAALTTFAAQAADPTHLYLLGDSADVHGGPAIVGEGGSFGTNALGATGYSFGANQGLVLSNVLPANVYTIDFSYSFDADSGYRKLIDFKSLTSDSGLYNLSQTLNFYPVTSGAALLVAGSLARVTLTRDATDRVVGYVNGIEQFSFKDGSGLASFSDPQQLGRMFHDDNATGGRESSSGFVDYVRIYDVALSAAEVGALTNPVPEPGTWALMAAGLLAVGAAARRKA